jgi:hypothetical protein
MKSSRMSTAIVLLITVVIVACDGGTRLRGQIHDPAGKPLEDVRVSLAQGGRSVAVTTGEDGVYEVGMTHSPFTVTLSLTAEKLGYTKFERRFSSADHLRSLDIIMMPVKN